MSGTIKFPLCKVLTLNFLKSKPKWVNSDSEAHNNVERTNTQIYGLRVRWLKVNFHKKKLATWIVVPFALQVSLKVLEVTLIRRLSSFTTYQQGYFDKPSIPGLADDSKGWLG